MAKRIVHELDHTRTNMAGLYKADEAIRSDIAAYRIEATREFVSKEDLKELKGEMKEFRTELINRFDSLEEKLSTLR